MKIRALLSVECIQLGGRAKDKEELFKQMIDLMVKTGKVMDVALYHNDMNHHSKFEQVEDDIAVISCNSEAISRPGIAVRILKQNPLDEIKYRMIFAIAVPKEEKEEEIQEALKVILRDRAFVNRLLAVRGKMEFLNILDEVDATNPKMEEGCL